MTEKRFFILKDDKEVTVIIREGDYTKWEVDDAFSSKQVYLEVGDD